MDHRDGAEAADREARVEVQARGLGVVEVKHVDQLEELDHVDLPRAVLIDQPELLDHLVLVGAGADREKLVEGGREDEILEEDNSGKSSGNRGFRGRMLGARGDVEDEYCSNLFYCWVASVNEGLRSGDIGALMPAPDPTDEWYHYMAIVLYQFSFWCFVITVLLSIIFGIIIDTFSQLRTEHQEKKKHMEGVCFICGVDRLTLDTQGSGFDKHIRDEHNMWQYAFALIHIRSKDPLEYTGWEAYVAAQLQEDDFGFLPSNNALSLHHYHSRKVREANRLSDKVNAMEASMAATLKQMGALSEQVAALTEQLQPASRLSSITGGRGSEAGGSSAAAQGTMARIATGLLSNRRSSSPTPTTEIVSEEQMRKAKVRI